MMRIPSAYFDEVVMNKSHELAETVIKKRRDYGTDNILKSPVDPRLAVLVRLFDKIQRFANLIENDTDPANESLQDTALDIMGYGMVLSTLLDDTFGLPLSDNKKEKAEEVLADAKSFIEKHMELFENLFNEQQWQDNRTRATTALEKELVMRRLTKLWINNPDLRFGQLIQNVLPEDIYNMEDKELIDTLEEFYEKN